MRAWHNVHIGRLGRADPGNLIWKLSIEMSGTSSVISGLPDGNPYHIVQKNSSKDVTCLVAGDSELV